MSSKLKVNLLRYTEDGEKLIASSAKLCYSAVGVDKIEEKLDDEKVESFIKMLMSVGHQSPIEHISFTFAIEGISRTLTHQLVRHRIGSSYSQQSQRYVKLDQFEYIIPPSIENVKEAKELFIKAMEEDQKYYDKISDILFKKHYERLINQGYKEEKARKEAEKMSIEDARYIFPNACETKIIVTMNARALFNFFEHRCCERAQWEIRSLATEMLRQVRHVAPTLFQYAGPPCVQGPCTEGKMTCGKIKEVREKFKSL
ncbi:thymidylate synthase ThyX [Gottschalkia purinilytica]|uniref:Flavin-dependent thymidylate synthase n=1 Tax=Gottschalkia purinilytica TaxID=1503 RepID=A0A0L0W8Z4_GOTPU|nr:FAD-dependent thymidylate synthase [Gottschalkia purinilytica]KNF07999.1 thymidylate synthase ThyX [Gottschalkia purinilytica]